MSSNSKSARRVALRKTITATHKNGDKVGASTRKNTNRNGWAQVKDENGRLAIFRERDQEAKNAEQAALKEEQAAAKAAAKAEREAAKVAGRNKRGRLDD